MTSRVPTIRNLFADGRALSPALACALLAACATSSEPQAPAVARTRAPEAYEKTVNNYLAFKLRPQKNSRIIVSPPEPNDCPIDGTPQSIRGWVVPVTRETFSGELTGKDTIRITAKPYWFWFSGETIAGVSSRADLCPGVVSAFDDADKARPPTTTTAPPPPPSARAEPAEASAKPAKTTKKKPTTSAASKPPSVQAHPKEPAKPPE